MDFLRKYSKIFLAVCALTAFGCAPKFVSAQQTRGAQFQVRLPTVSFFNVSTVVSVPDAGVMRLGGISRSATGVAAYGTPFSGSAGIGRPFRGRSLGSSSLASNANAHVRVIINREIEENLMGKAARGRQAREIVDPNGSPAIQQKADFLTRNIGR